MFTKFNKARKRARKRRNVRTVSTLRRNKAGRTRALPKAKLSTSVFLASPPPPSPNSASRKKSDRKMRGRGVQDEQIPARFEEHNKRLESDNPFNLDRQVSSVSHYLDDTSATDLFHGSFAEGSSILDRSVSRGPSFAMYGDPTRGVTHSISKQSNTFSQSTLSDDEGPTITGLSHTAFSTISSSVNPVFDPDVIVPRKVKSRKKRVRRTKSKRSSSNKSRLSSKRISSSVLRQESSKMSLPELRTSNRAFTSLRKSSKNLETELNFNDIEKVLQTVEQNRRSTRALAEETEDPIVEKAKQVEKVTKTPKSAFKFNLKLEKIDIDEPRKPVKQEPVTHSSSTNQFKDDFVSYLNGNVLFIEGKNVPNSLKDRLIRRIPGSTFCEVKTDEENITQPPPRRQKPDSHLFSYFRKKSKRERMSFKESVKSLRSMLSLHKSLFESDIRLRPKVSKFVSEGPLQTSQSSKEDDSSKLQRIAKKKNRAKKYKEQIEQSKKTSFDDKQIVTCVECGKSEFVHKETTNLFIDDWCVKCYKELHGIRGFNRRKKELSQERAFNI